MLAVIEGLGTRLVKILVIFYMASSVNSSYTIVSNVMRTKLMISSIDYGVWRRASQGLCLGQLCDGGQGSGSVFRAAV